MEEHQLHNILSLECSRLAPEDQLQGQIANSISTYTGQAVPSSPSPPRLIAASDFWGPKIEPTPEKPPPPAQPSNPAPSPPEMSVLSPPPTGPQKPRVVYAPVSVSPPASPAAVSPSPPPTAFRSPSPTPVPPPSPRRHMMNNGHCLLIPAMQEDIPIDPALMDLDNISSLSSTGETPARPTIDYASKPLAVPPANSGLHEKKDLQGEPKRRAPPKIGRPEHFAVGYSRKPTKKRLPKGFRYMEEYKHEWPKAKENTGKRVRGASNLPGTCPPRTYERSLTHPERVESDPSNGFVHDHLTDAQKKVAWKWVRAGNGSGKDEVGVLRATTGGLLGLPPQGKRGDGGGQWLPAIGATVGQVYGAFDVRVPWVMTMDALREREATKNRKHAEMQGHDQHQEENSDEDEETDDDE